MNKEKKDLIEGIFGMYQSGSDRTSLNDIGPCSDLGSYINEGIVEVIRTGRPTTVNDMDYKISGTSATRTKRTPSQLLAFLSAFFFAGLVILIIARGVDPVPNSLILLLAVAYAIGAILLKNQGISASAMLQEGQREAYVHTIQQKEYYVMKAGKNGRYIKHCIVTLMGFKFEIPEIIYDTASEGDNITCVIFAKNGRYYITFVKCPKY